MYTASTVDYVILPPVGYSVHGTCKL